MAERKANKGGRRPNAGRKSKAEENGLKRLLDRCWPSKQRAQAIRQLATRASNGDLESIKLLLAYAYGKPTERKEITGADGGDIAINIIEFRGPENS